MSSPLPSPFLTPQDTQMDCDNEEQASNSYVAVEYSGHATLIPSCSSPQTDSSAASASTNSIDEASGYVVMGHSEHATQSPGSSSPRSDFSSVVDARTASTDSINTPNEDAFDDLFDGPLSPVSSLDSDAGNELPEPMPQLDLLSDSELLEWTEKNVPKGRHVQVEVTRRRLHDALVSPHKELDPDPNMQRKAYCPLCYTGLACTRSRKAHMGNDSCIGIAKDHGNEIPDKQGMVELKLKIRKDQLLHLRRVYWRELLVNQYKTREEDPEEVKRHEAHCESAFTEERIAIAWKAVEAMPPVKNLAPNPRSRGQYHRPAEGKHVKTDSASHQLPTAPLLLDEDYPDTAMNGSYQTDWSPTAAQYANMPAPDYDNLYGNFSMVAQAGWQPSYGQYGSQGQEWTNQHGYYHQGTYPYTQYNAGMAQQGYQQGLQAGSPERYDEGAASGWASHPNVGGGGYPPNAGAYGGYYPANYAQSQNPHLQQWQQQQSAGQVSAQGTAYGAYEMLDEETKAQVDGILKSLGIDPAFDAEMRR